MALAGKSPVISKGSTAILSKLLLIPSFLGPCHLDPTLCRLRTSAAKVFVRLTVLSPHWALHAYACFLFRDTDETTPMGTKKALSGPSGAAIVSRAIREAGLIWQRSNSLVLSKQCLDRRIADMKGWLMRWVLGGAKRNSIGATVRWRFNKDNARIKLQRHYSNLQN